MKLKQLENKGRFDGNGSASVNVKTVTVSGGGGGGISGSAYTGG